MDGWTTRLAIRIASFVAAAIIFIGGLGFLVLSAYLALLAHVSPPMAALIAAIAAFLLGAITLLAAHGVIALMRRRRQRDAGRLAETFREILGDEIVSIATENPHATVFTSLATGFAIGAVPELRNLLRDLLRKP
jgi:hypothetical protein